MNAKYSTSSVDGEIGLELKSAVWRLVLAPPKLIVFLHI